MTFGAILVAGALQRSGDAAVAGVRSDVLHKFGLVRTRWRRRTAAASTTFELVLGTAILAYALYRAAQATMESVSGDSSPTDSSPDHTPPTAGLPEGPATGIATAA